MADDRRKFKYEYRHHELGPDLHFGHHSLYGRHVAIGKGPNTIHIYPTKIHIGGSKDGTSIPLDPEQILIASRVLQRFDDRLRGQPPAGKVVLPDLEVEDAT